MTCAKGILGISAALWLAGEVPRAWGAPSFRADKNYPDLGLSLRVLGNAEPEPLAQTTRYTYRFTRGAESFTRDMFDPRELWYAAQHAGQWRDKDGNVLILGRPTRMLPPFSEKHVLREDFDKAMLEPGAAFDPADTNALAAWVKAFAGCTVLGAEPLRVQSFSLAAAVSFSIKEPALVAGAFRVKRRLPSGRTEPSDWYCAVVRIADGTPRAKVRRDFETQLLAHVAALPQSGSGSGGGVQPKALAVAPAGARTPAAPIPDHPSRSAARKSIANMKDWWYAETPEYIFLSDIRSAAGRKLVRDLQATMPPLRGAFARLVPPLCVTNDVSVVRIYEQPEAYKQYVGKGMEWSVGAWSPMRRELVILAQGKDGDETMRIIRHEGFHQYLFLVSGLIESSAWFNEGHACFFEAAGIPRQGRVEIPENPQFVGFLLEHLDEAAGRIPELIRFSYADFYKGSEESRRLNYATAWGLVYFLRKGLHPEKHAAYTALFDTYLKTLAATRDAGQATAAAFAGVDMPGFQADFVEFWKKNRNAARHFDPLAGGVGVQGNHVAPDRTARSRSTARSPAFDAAGTP